MCGHFNVKWNGTIRRRRTKPLVSDTLSGIATGEQPNTLQEGQERIIDLIDWVELRREIRLS